MPSVLEARRDAKDALTNALNPTRVLFPHEAAPTAGEYVTVQVITAPTENAWKGVTHDRVTVQVDVWTLASNDSRAGVLGSQAEAALQSAGWRISRNNQPLTFEGQTGNRWFRYCFDASKAH